MTNTSGAVPNATAPESNGAHDPHAEGHSNAKEVGVTGGNVGIAGIPPGSLIAYKCAPAAKSLHHAFIGGLLEHVVSLFELCHQVAGHYPQIDRDLLLEELVRCYVRVTLGGPVDPR